MSKIKFLIGTSLVILASTGLTISCQANDTSGHKWTINDRKDLPIAELPKSKTYLSNIKKDIITNQAITRIEYRDNSKNFNLYKNNIIDDISTHIQQNNVETVEILNKSIESKPSYKAEIKDHKIVKIINLQSKNNCEIYTNFVYSNNRLTSFDKVVYNPDLPQVNENIALRATFSGKNLSLTKQEWSNKAIKRTFNKQGWETSFASYLYKDNIQKTIEEATVWDGIAEVRHFINITKDGNNITSEDFFLGKYKAIANPNDPAHSNIDKPPLQATYFNDADTETGVTRIRRKLINEVKYNSDFSQKTAKPVLKTTQTTFYRHEDNTGKNISQIANTPTMWHYTTKAFYDKNGNLNSLPKYYREFEHNEGKTDEQAIGWGIEIMIDNSGQSPQKVGRPILTAWIDFNEFNQPLTEALYLYNSQANTNKDIDKASVWQNIGVIYEYDQKHRIQYRHDTSFYFAKNFLNSGQRLIELKVNRDGETKDGKLYYAYQTSREYVYDLNDNISLRKQFNIGLDANNKQTRSWLKVEYNYQDNKLQWTKSFSSAINLDQNNEELAIDSPVIKNWAVLNRYSYNNNRIKDMTRIWSTENVIIENDKRFMTNGLEIEKPINTELFVERPFVDTSTDGTHNGRVGFYDMGTMKYLDGNMNKFSTFYADKARRFIKNAQNENELVEFPIYLSNMEEVEIANPKNDPNHPTIKIWREVTSATPANELNRANFYARLNKATQFIQNIVKQMKDANEGINTFFKNRHYSLKVAWEFFLKILQEREYIQFKNRAELEKYLTINWSKGFLIWSQIPDLDKKIDGVVKFELKYEPSQSETKEAKAKFIYFIERNKMQLDYNTFNIWHQFLSHEYFKIPGYKTNAQLVKEWSEYEIEQVVQYNQRDSLKNGVLKPTNEIDPNSWATIAFSYTDPQTNKKVTKTYVRANQIYKDYTIADIKQVFLTFISTNPIFKK